jgi:hypothetical protein
LTWSNLDANYRFLFPFFPELLLVGDRRRILSDCVQLDLDLDVVADHQAAGFESHIPVQTEVFPIDVVSAVNPAIAWPRDWCPRH